MSRNLFDSKHGNRSVINVPGIPKLATMLLTKARETCLALHCHCRHPPGHMANPCHFLSIFHHKKCSLDVLGLVAKWYLTGQHGLHLFFLIKRSILVWSNPKPFGRLLSLSRDHHFLFGVYLGDAVTRLWARCKSQTTFSLSSNLGEWLILTLLCGLQSIRLLTSTSNPIPREYICHSGFSDTETKRSSIFGDSP